MTITVALVGDPTTSLVAADMSIPGILYPNDYRIPYADRPTHELEVAEEETLGSVIARAAAAFEVQTEAGAEPLERIAFVGFYKPADDDELRLVHELTLVDDQGRIRWEPWWKEVPYGEVVKAGEAGVLDGDHLRPYLILQPGLGNGALADWPALVDAWNLFWAVLDRIDIALGIYAGKKLIYDKLRERSRNAPKVVESHYRDWQRNGGRPDNVKRLLGQRPWHEADLAERLGCTPAEAEAFLLGSGWTRGSSGLWRPGGDEEAKLLEGNMAFLVESALGVKPAEVERVLRERTERLLATGQAPDEPSPDELAALEWQEEPRPPRFDE